MSLPILRLPKRVYRKMPKSFPLMKQYPLYALRSDGVNGHVLVADAASISPIDQITVACWVNYDVLENIGLFWKIEISYNLYGIQGTDITFFTIDALGGTSTGNVSAVPVVAGTYYHIAGTLEADHRARVYLNAVLGAVGNVCAGIRDIPGDLWIGRRAAGAEYLDGIQVEPLIYDRSLSRAEIQYNMRNPMNPIRAGLVLWHPTIEGQGLSVADYSGFGNDGTLIGGVSWYEMALYEALADAP